MSLRSLLSRMLAPNLGRCYRCKTSLWGLIQNEPHTTWYGDGAGCSPLCEPCWQKLTPDERLPFYDALVATWIACLPQNTAEYLGKRELIREAVRLGG